MKNFYGITAPGVMVELEKLKASFVGPLLRLVMPAEGEHDFEHMQVLVETEHGLEMRCFQY